MSSTLEPTTWSSDTGQRLTCFDSCQLAIIWIFNMIVSQGQLVFLSQRAPSCATPLFARAREPFTAEGDDNTKMNAWDL